MHYITLNLALYIDKQQLSTAGPISLEIDHIIINTLYDCMWKYAGRQDHIYKVNNYIFYILCKNTFTFELIDTVIAYVEVSPVTPLGLSLN